MQNHVPLLALPPARITANGSGSGHRFTRDEVMTSPEVAELLHLPVSTVCYFARRGELPGRRLGRTWRFLRSSVEDVLPG